LFGLEDLPGEWYPTAGLEGCPDNSDEQRHSLPRRIATNRPTRISSESSEYLDIFKQRIDFVSGETPFLKLSEKSFDDTLT